MVTSCTVQSHGLSNAARLRLRSARVTADFAPEFSRGQLALLHSLGDRLRKLFQARIGRGDGRIGLGKFLRGRAPLRVEIALVGAAFRLEGCPD
jgi:hypothetical protein